MRSIRSEQARRRPVTEDGSGRHGTTFVTTTHLATALHPATSVPAVTDVLPGNGLQAWTLWGSIAAAGVTTLTIFVVASARRRRSERSGWLS